MKPYKTKQINQTTIEWTGRTDTLGTEVYEGDLVEYAGKVAEVVWNKEAWRLKYKELGFEQELSLGAVNGKDIKVVGNIWETEA